MECPYEGMKDWNPDTGEATCEECGLPVYYASLIILEDRWLCLDCQTKWKPQKWQTDKES